MPAAAAHYYFGQQVKKILPEATIAIIKRNKAVFDLGLQGPDLLFYYNPFKENPVLSLGMGIHSQIAFERIAKAASTLKKKWDEAAFCYLLGYTCHYVLDSDFHHDIGIIAPEIKNHFRLETELDRQIILKHYAQKPAAFKRHNLVKTRLKSYACLRPVYPELTQEELKKCAHGIAFYLRAIYSPAGIQKRIVYLIERAMGRAGFFSALAVSNEVNEVFYKDAKALIARIEGLEEKGSQAVVNLTEHIRGDTPLSDLFQRNFG